MFREDSAQSTQQTVLDLRVAAALHSSCPALPGKPEADSPGALRHPLLAVPVPTHATYAKSVVQRGSSYYRASARYRRGEELVCAKPTGAFGPSTKGGSPIYNPCPWVQPSAADALRICCAPASMTQWPPATSVVRLSSPPFFLSTRHRHRDARFLATVGVTSLVARGRGGSIHPTLQCPRRTQLSDMSELSEPSEPKAWAVSSAG